MVWLRSQFGETAAVPEHDREEFAGVPVAWDVTLRFGEGSKEPAEIELVGPDGDVNLVAREEGDGGADAVDGGAIGKIAFEIEAQTLLGSTADGDDDVLGAKPVESLEKSGVVDGRVAVHGSHVDAVFGDDDSLPCEPVEITLCTDWAGHDPERVAGLANVWLEEKIAEVLEAGEALDGDRLQTIPDEDHEGRVGDREVRVEQSVSIVGAAVEVLEGWSSGDYEETAFGAHDVDGFFCRAVEEVDTEDAVGDRECRHEEMSSSLILFEDAYLLLRKVSDLSVQTRRRTYGFE